MGRTVRPRNWVFLGDSLTEGIGSTRATYVTELVKLLRAGDPSQTVYDMRLREVEPETFNPYIRTNLAGFFDGGEGGTESALWVWNLASEGRTIESDVSWLPLLRNLAPERVFIFRGSLESIIRPAAVRSGNWPAWVPAAWRNFSAMDPRCYFSGTWYRYGKQAGIDALKQKARLRLLAERPGCPLMDADVILAHYRHLHESLRALGTTVCVLGLIPPERSRFPGSAEHFSALNDRLRALAAEMGAEFVDWAPRFDASGFYRDGFHPNQQGAARLARILHDQMPRWARS